MHNGSLTEKESIKNLLGQLVSQIGTIIRGEIALATQNFREKINDLRNGLILLAAALFLGFTAFLCLCAAVVIKLTEVISPAGAASMVGGILIGMSFLLAFFGYRKIKTTVQ